ncbi:MAG: CPBP family intramembrane glutamic endopeptidase [Pseudomonadota bacterium]
MTDLSPACAPVPSPAPARDGRLRRFDLLWIVAIILVAEAAAFLAALLIGVGVGLFYGYVLQRPIDAAIVQAGDLTQGAIVAGLLATAAILALGSLWLARRRGIDRPTLGLRASAARWYGAGAGFFVLFLLLDWALSNWLDPTGELQRQMVGRFFVKTDSPIWATTLFLAIGPVTATAEEMLFRGLLYRWFRERGGIAMAVLLSGAVFGLAHLYFLTPGGLAGIVFTAEITLFGFAAALLYQASGSLWPAILFHMLNNSVVVLSAYHSA